MIQVNLNKAEPIERALKRLKRKLDRDDIIKNLELYIAKIRRTLIQVLEEEQENENKSKIFY